MRKLIFAAAIALAACTAPTGGPTERLTPGDSATELITGGPLALQTQSRGPAVEGADPVITLTLSAADGRTLRFQESNHTPNDLMAQAPGGPLAQVMGLFGEESPTLYQRVDGGAGAPFICGAEGPLMLGVYRAPDGQISMVGLKSGFEFETLADGSVAAFPFSPDHVCARLRFRAGG